MDPLIELFDRIPPLVEAAVEDLTADGLATPPEPGANTVAWLVWHLTRVQDDHVADVAGEPQVWEQGDWAPRFGLPEDAMDTGYGHDQEQVLAIRAEPDALVEYHRAVAERTRSFLEGLEPEDLDRVVDEDWDPPVTLGARLVSVASDDLQHVGQAAYARGQLLGRGSASD
jgi:uncharacterized damage-inducible protein DinB